MKTVTVSELISILEKIKNSDGGNLPVYAYTEGMNAGGLFGSAEVADEEKEDPYLEGLPKRVILT